MIDEIIKSFTDLTPMLWVSQISGVIGLITLGIAYLFDKKRFLAIGSLSFVFFIIEQAFALLYSNLVVSSVCFIRNILMFIMMVKYKKELSKYIVLALLVVMWSGVLIYMGISNTFNIWDNYLPPAIVTMSTITQNNKNEFVVKGGSAIHETGFFIYYLAYRLPLSILRQGILIIATLVGIGILIYKRVKNKKNIENINME